MPLHQTAEYDPVTAMIEVKSSIVFEMLVSLQGIVDSWKLQKLSEKVASVLGEEFISSTTALYRRIFVCCSFTELAVDYPARDDVPGFIEYVAALPDRDFTFYILGRWFPLEQVPDAVTSESIQVLIDSHSESEYLHQLYPDLEWADHVGNLRQDLCTQWKTYWSGFFEHEVSDLKERWRISIDEKHEMLDRSGGSAVLKQISGHVELPPPIPEGVPINKIELIPLCHTPRRTYIFYGYGSAQYLYDCSRTVEHERRLDDYKQKSLTALKALADENRLKILKKISQNERLFNGKTIAEKLELSPSVVSRHLAQLKDAGLITEHTTDNRNMTYSFVIERLRELGGDLELYIRD